MIRLLAAVLLLTYSLFGWAMAYPEGYSGVPHDSFKEGDVIDHTKFNQNNSSIKDAINDRVPVPSNCSTNQIIKYDGGGWVCTDMPADGAPGADGADGVGFPGVVATLRSSSLPDLIGAESASSVFDAVSNIASNSECGDFFPHDCELYVDGVTDHRRCVTQIEYGGTQWSVEPNSDHIKIATDMFTGNWVAIVIQCIN